MKATSELNVNPELETSKPPISTASKRPTFSPQDLLAMAEEEEDQQEVAEYVQVIGVLRDKSFSYREISNWLQDRGVQMDHNAIYRAYMKSLRRDELAQELDQQEEEAREESQKDW